MHQPPDVAPRDAATVHSDFADDPDFAPLLQVFVEQLADRRRTLEELYRADLMTELRTAAHQLKGAGGGYGYPGLTLLAQQLEVVCAENDRLLISARLDALFDYINRIRI